MDRQDLSTAKRAWGSVVGRWVNTGYYRAAERHAQRLWNDLILPFLDGTDVDYSRSLELAVGHGRMTTFLLDRADTVIGVDVLSENIDACRKRYAGVDALTLIQNDGATLEGVATGSVTFGFCFDSMVHFDSDIVRSYLKEFRRVLVPGGLVFLHHSNHTGDPKGDFQKAPHARNFMSMVLMAHYAHKCGLEVVRQTPIGWGGGPNRRENLDGLSLLRAPVNGSGTPD